MSYRSLKRVLGETSLERKCRFLFGACLFLLISGSFWWYGRQTEHLVYRQNRNTGRLLVDRVMITEHWEKLESDDRFKPVIKGLTEKLGKQKYDWWFILPASTAGEQAAAEQKDDQGKKRPPRDDFERAVLEEFLQNSPPPQPEGEGQGEVLEYREQIADAGREYQYFEPIRAKESCLTFCHRSPPGGSGIDLSGTGVALGSRHPTGAAPLAEGDLMAVVKVTIPHGPTQVAINWNRAILLSTAIITVYLAMVASYAIVRYVIVKPLRHLHDVSDAISRGNINLRAEIHTGDEFEALAVAFNRMLSHLMAAQQELRQANAALDAKVDELAQANMRLYELNMLKSDFLATMSHELRTPLNSILGFSEVLGSVGELGEKQKRYVQHIEKSGRALLDLINDILDLAKIESGKMDLHPTDFAIEPVIATQCDLARPLAERKKIDLEMRVQGGLPPLYQDQGRVRQILNNLLSNAIKFTPEGGHVSVTAQRDEQGRLVLSVSDTGVGIAPEDQQMIFEKFRQGRLAAPNGDAMTREYTGSGLGLSIVKELCRLMGGEVTVQSELGRGSTFTVWLPWRLERLPAHEPSGEPVFPEFSRFSANLIRDRAAASPPT
jgi:signal transduction histidine kinase